MIEDSDYDIISDGIANLYYENKAHINIAPKGVASLYLKHNLNPKAKGLLYIVPDPALTESFVYILDSMVLYSGEERIRINLYNFGQRSLTIEDKDVICDLILNELEEESDD